MKNIIVPIDFSEYSEYALQTAAILAKKNDSKIIALHMLELSDAFLSHGENELAAEAVFFIKMAEKKFEKFLDKPYLEGVKVTRIVKHLKVFKEVSKVAEEHNADLVVMGSRGSSGVKEVFLGSNTEKVVRYSEIPVLVVKEAPEGLEFDNVVFASNFLQKSLSSYLNASRLFGHLGSSFKLLFVNLPGEQFYSTEEIEDRIKGFLEEAHGNTDKYADVSVCSDYTVEKGILSFGKKVDANLIVLPTNGRTGLAHFFEGSISEDVANHAKVPVMTIKIKK
ncbi:MAG: universal stress protein UspA [Bacteroidetes bacterium MedPE-SWsnd-G2]|nr:MAG: universal stress protein UspA [Bacteroidetes bacterium MedPE-SWsnd-G2]